MRTRLRKIKDTTRTSHPTCDGPVAAPRLLAAIAMNLFAQFFAECCSIVPIPYLL